MTASSCQAERKEKQLRLVKFALLSALFVWAILAYAKLGEYMYEGTLFAREIDGRPYVSDFANHYNAALLASKSLASHCDIYDIALQNQSLKELIKPVVPEQPFYLQYPPYFFCLVLPLSALPIPAAWFVWNLVAIALAITALIKLSDLPRNETFIAIALIFSSYPAWLSIEIGQTSLYLLAFASFMLFFLKEKRFVLAGLSSAFLMVKLQYAPVFFLIGLIRGGLKFFCSWFIALALFIISSILLLGLDNVLNYPEALLKGETGQEVSGVSSFMMQNLRGELVLFAGEHNALASVVVLASFALGIVLSGWLLFKAQKTNSYSEIKKACAQAIIIALLFSPHTHTQDYLLAGTCAFLLMPEAKLAKTKWRSLAEKMLLAFAPLSWLFFYLQPLFMLFHIQAFFVYLLLLCLFLFFSQQSQTDK